MDLNLQISSVSDLKPFKSAWQVHVKLLHSWNSFHTTTGSDLEMVLTDVNGVKIQAICKQSLLQRLQMHCDVGKWKVINNFTLSPATGIYRHTDHVYKIHFLSQTTITDSNLGHENMFLDLKDFRDIINGSHDKRFLIDVVGEVLEVSGLDIVVSAKKEVTKIDFVLRDINKKVFKKRVIFDELDVPSFWCQFCQLTVTKVAPRYKVELLVQDETGESKFTVNDTVAASMVKTKASKLVNVQSYELQDQDVLPPEIVEIVGKTYGFGISVDEVDVFSASKFWNLNDIMWKRIKSLHEMSIHPMKKQCTSSMKIEYIDHDGEKEKKND
ncbi:hypothetical protein Bca101_057226 [Brassica carinata]